MRTTVVQVVNTTAGAANSGSNCIGPTEREKSTEACAFCELGRERVVVQNSLAFGFADAYAVVLGHHLVIPRRHVADYWGLSRDELLACHELLHRLRLSLLSESAVTGFNIGLNAGASAGQTVFHCHFHLIPRRLGDVNDPRGGVRGVIPGRATYIADPAPSSRV